MLYKKFFYLTTYLQCPHQVSIRYFCFCTFNIEFALLSCKLFFKTIVQQRKFRCPDFCIMRKVAVNCEITKCENVVRLDFKTREIFTRCSL